MTTTDDLPNSRSTRLTLHRLSPKTPKNSNGVGERDISRKAEVKKRKSKAARGLVTRRIVYTSRKSPDVRHQEIKVDVRNGTIIDMDHAAALVAVRTHLALDDVRVIRIETC